MRINSVLPLLVLAAACSDSTGLAKAGVSFQLATTPNAAVAQVQSGLIGGAAAVASGVTVSAGSASLTIDTVQLVVRKLKLERTDASCPAGSTDSTSDDARCPDFRVGPLLVSLPLTPGAQQAFNADIAAGTYGEVKFKIHAAKPGDPRDTAFVRQFPAFAGKSVRVTGSYQASAGAAPVRFVYEDSLEVEQETPLNPPLVVGAAGPTPLTLFVDVSTWFKTSGGSALIDPTTLPSSGSARQLVQQNIKLSFRAFKDSKQRGISD